MGRKVFDRYTGQINTTDNTKTTIATIPVANNSNIVINVHCSARNTSNQDSYYKQITALFKNISGTISKVESDLETKHLRDAALSSCSVEFTISGTNVLVDVTGVNLTNLDWQVFIDTKEN